MINRKFSGPLGRATKFSHPRATMSVIVVMFIAANKFTAFCAIRLLDFRPTDHRRQQNIGGVRVLVASTTKGVDVTLGAAGSRDARGLRASTRPRSSRVRTEQRIRWPSRHEMIGLCIWIQSLLASGSSTFLPHAWNTGMAHLALC